MQLERFREPRKFHDSQRPQQGNRSSRISVERKLSKWPNWKLCREIQGGSFWATTLLDFCRYSYVWVYKYPSPYSCKYFQYLHWFVKPDLVGLFLWYQGCHFLEEEILIHTHPKVIRQPCICGWFKAGCHRFFTLNLEPGVIFAYV